MSAFFWFSLGFACNGLIALLTGVGPAQAKHNLVAWSAAIRRRIDRG